MAGRRAVQLIFREANEHHLCLSTDLTMTKLPLGKQYKIEGEFRQLGDRYFIHEPLIKPLKRAGLSLLQIGLIAGTLLLLGGGATAAIYIPKHDHTGTASTAAPETTNVGSASGTNQDVATAAATDTSSTTAPAATTPTTQPTTTTKPTTKTTVTTPVTTTTTTTTTPTAYCDPVVTTPFGTQTVDDPNQPVGYSVVTQQGIDGQTQTCYPDGTTASAQTKPLVTEQDQITTVGTQPVGP
jgi:hypothetical protein